MGRLSGGHDPGRRAGHRGRGQRVDTVTLPTFCKLPKRPEAVEAANIVATVLTQVEASGRAYWLPSAGEMVCWVIVCQVGAETLQVYGAGGPAGSLPAACQIGMDGLHAALERLACSTRLACAMAELARQGGAA